MEVIGAYPVGSFEERCFGSILGSFIGDSCGSFLEFSNEKAT